MIWITLSESEMAVARLIGRMRHQDAAAKGRKDVVADIGNSLDRHINGAAGEMAVAKAIGRYWDADIVRFKGADILPDLQVRWGSWHNGDLIVRDDDDPGCLYYHVTGSPEGLMCVHGFIDGWAAMCECFRKNPGGYKPAYCVPHAELVDVA